MPNKISLREYITALMNERDLRLQQRWEAQNEAARAFKEVVEARLDILNEHRRQVSDLQATMMPRAESELRHREIRGHVDVTEKATRTQIESLERAVTSMAARGLGMGQLWGWIGAAIGTLVALFTAAWAVLHR